MRCLLSVGLFAASRAAALILLIVVHPLRCLACSSMPLQLLHVHRLRVETSDTPISEAEAEAAAAAVMVAVQERAARVYETDASGKKVLVVAAAAEAR
jgi:hypothetical protein